MRAFNQTHDSMKLSFPSRLGRGLYRAFQHAVHAVAMASYTCPGIGGGKSESASASMPGMEMAGCEGMDMQQPTLCHTHAFGEATKQSLRQSRHSSSSTVHPRRALYWLCQRSMSLSVRLLHQRTRRYY